MTTAQKIVWTGVGTWVAIVPALLLAHSAGPDPRYTAAPGDAPLACSSAGCHTGQGKSGPINAAGGSVSAVFSGSGQYVPGQAQTITVTVTDPVNSIYGFQMTARLDSDQVNGQAGTFTPGGADTFVMCDNTSPRLPGKSCPSSPSAVEFIEHSAPKRSSFTFQWTPPATNTGPVHIYVAGNAVNGDTLADAADHVYTASYVLTPTVPIVCTTDKPSISAVVSASAFGQAKTFAAGSWLEIYGSNFATNSRSWGGADFTGNTAPTILDKVSVSINDVPAAVNFISANQVNVQAPADAKTGPVNVTLTNCTQTSAAIQVTKTDLVPGLYTATVNNKQYLGAFTLAGSPTGNPNSPAKPGDIIVAYGIGFGDTTPSFAPGTIVTAQNSFLSSNPFTVLFGTAPDPHPIYAGLGPGYVGLYQFDLTVPKLADGDYTMSFQIGSVKAAQTLLFTVKN
jgi:uncharacterized protein (TIGR03437 family)